MKIKEIRQKETSHLLHELAEQQKHLFALRTQSVTEKLEDPSQLAKARRGIARIKTVLRERSLVGAASNASTMTPAAEQAETPAAPVAS